MRGNPLRTLEIGRFDALDYPTNEAINTLCTNLFFAGADIKKIMITSCRPQEGKSFISMNLMRSLAGLGKKVVLVDADIRASALVGMYGIRVSKRDMGLSHYLSGMCVPEDILVYTNMENAYLILSGKNVVNSLPLFNTPKFELLLNLLAELFDVVLVDAPPVGTIIDAAQIARSCDGTLFVIQSNLIGRQELSEAIRQIEKSACPILGTVLNKFNMSQYGTKKYYYSHYSAYAHNSENPLNRTQYVNSGSGRKGK